MKNAANKVWAKIKSINVTVTGKIRLGFVEITVAPLIIVHAQIWACFLLHYQEVERRDTEKLPASVNYEVLLQPFDCLFLLISFHRLFLLYYSQSKRYSNASEYVIMETVMRNEAFSDNRG